MGKIDSVTARDSGRGIEGGRGSGEAMSAHTGWSRKGL
jgi:hypothetical protein